MASNLWVPEILSRSAFGNTVSWGVEMTCSSRWSIEVDETASLQDSIKDGGRQILVV
jgi:hypothetical protein